MNKRIPMLVATLGAAALMGAGLVGAAFAQAPTQPSATPTAQAERSGQRAEGLPTRGDKPVRGGVSKTGTEVLSELTGLTSDEIKEQLQAGQSLAQIAESKGIAKDKLIAAIVAAKTVKINDASRGRHADPGEGRRGAGQAHRTGHLGRGPCREAGAGQARDRHGCQAERRSHAARQQWRCSPGSRG